MSEPLQPPGFDADQYARPNQNWVCGYACEGRACKLGPGPGGECRATAECKPVLDLKPGETKGRWRCTRSKNQGGACELGPGPDGTCCRPLPRCSPVRSLRVRRGRLTLAVTALTVGALLVLLYGPWRLTFINPGPVSSHHTGKAFAELLREQSKGAPKSAALAASAFGADQGCAVCHTEALAGPAGWLKAAFTVKPGPFEVNKLAAVSRAEMTSIDRACLKCHKDHTFHQPNVVRDHSCSSCHREHLTSGHMRKPEDAQCLSCHGDGATMQASAAKGREIAAKRPSEFEYRSHLGPHVFGVPRPTNGYTKVFASFAGDHPEFQVHADKLSDTNPLRFNHALHFSSTVPPINGRKLDCASCHEPDASGAYYRRVNFERHCRKCHSLQFDAGNPQLQLPHGNETFVRSFLRSLPAHYAELARREHKLSRAEEIARFVARSMSGLTERFESGEGLERRVFMSTERWAPVASVGGSPTLGAAPFAGCAWCHKVTESPGTVPPQFEVARPSMPERWMPRGSFNHAKHQHLDCAKCHDVARSSVTADVNLPRKALCAECHSPKGGVVHSCSTCHSFHTTHRR
ncbi:MAG: hypothetical protein FJ386_08895 [Verrucomicrobia bacterium]|nr:hypothetical protein [Verrucomicrobiota bacterium]